MTADTTKAAILGALGRITPESDLSGLRGDVPLRDQLEIDSMDFLNLLVAVATELGVEIPERDYGKVLALDGLVNYVEAKRRG
ncbi:MAG: acyl carrier protein [Nannocystaceae bacterium]